MKLVKSYAAKMWYNDFCIQPFHGTTIIILIPIKRSLQFKADREFKYSIIPRALTTNATNVKKNESEKIAEIKMW